MSSKDKDERKLRYFQTNKNRKFISSRLAFKIFFRLNKIYPKRNSKTQEIINKHGNYVGESK